MSGVTEGQTTMGGLIETLTHENNQLVEIRDRVIKVHDELFGSVPRPGDDQEVGEKSRTPQDDFISTANRWLRQNSELSRQIIQALSDIEGRL